MRSSDESSCYRHSVTPEASLFSLEDAGDSVLVAMNHSERLLAERGRKWEDEFRPFGFPFEGSPCGLIQRGGILRDYFPLHAV